MSTQQIDTVYPQYALGVLQKELPQSSALPNYLQVLWQNQTVTGKDGVSLSSGDPKSRTAQVLKALEQLNGANYVSNIDLTRQLFKTNTQHDSYFLNALDNQALNTGTNMAFSYNDLSNSYASVNSYINPADPTVLSYLDNLHQNGEIRANMSFDQKVTALYNHVINNFDYVQENNDAWAWAGETIAKGGGDCEDLTLLLHNLIYTQGLEDGLSADQLNQKINSVVGKHNQFGDHVYLEYTDAAGKTHALDSAMALQGTVENLDKLKTASDYRKNFDIYFTFNDQTATVIKKSEAQNIDNSSNRFIDLNQPEIQKELKNLYATQVLDKNDSPDETMVKLFNYFQKSFTVITSPTSQFSWNSLKDHAGSEKDINILFANLMGAAMQAAGVPESELNQRLGLAFCHDETKSYTFLKYTDESGTERFIDASNELLTYDLKITPQSALKMLEDIKNLGLPTQIADWPTAQQWDALGLKLNTNYLFWICAYKIAACKALTRNLACPDLWRKKTTPPIGGPPWL